MTTNLSVLDRLRIERVVWSLDQQLYELPRRRRIATRREVRDNLRSAAADVGTTDALRRIGPSSRLAADYLDAELGAGPRPSWLAAGLFGATVPLVLTSLLTEAARAFGDGLAVGRPHASGTFGWNGITPFQSRVTYTFTDGAYTFVGGAWTPLTWAFLVVGTIAVGRLWRVVPRFRGRAAGSGAET